VQRIGNGNALAVQIATRENILAGGPTALTVNMEKVADGVSVQLSKQAWLGRGSQLGDDGNKCTAQPVELNRPN